MTTRQVTTHLALRAADRLALLLAIRRRPRAVSPSRARSIDPPALGRDVAGRRKVVRVVLRGRSRRLGTVRQRVVPASSSSNSGADVLRLVLLRVPVPLRALVGPGPGH